MKYYTLREASEELGLKVRTLREWAVKRKIKAGKFSNSRVWIIPAAEVKRVKKERMGYDHKN